MDEERKQRLMSLPGYVLLGRTAADNAYQGYVEHSFSLSLDRDRTHFYWSGDAVSNFGTRHKLDGKAHAEKDMEHLRKSRPDMEWAMYDARDAATLPVVLDWDDWLDGHEPAQTLSGVKDKYRARNIRFRMKEDND